MTLFRSVGWGFFALAAIVVAGCSESTPPATPASVSSSQTIAVDGTAGLPLAIAPTFIVKDAGGSTLGGVGVTIAVTAGGGTIPDAPSKSSGGSPTSIGTWTLGKIAGLNSVTVTVGSLQPIVISVNGKAGAPASIVFTAGNNQVAFAGTAPIPTPVAQVRDQFGNGVPGAPVLFTIGEGDGTVSGTVATADAQGAAAATSYRLGKSAIPQSLRASSGGFSALAGITVQTDYNIDLRFFGTPVPDSAAAAFTAAVARIKASVIGDVPDINVASPIDMNAACGVTGTTFEAGIVDDLVIYAAVKPIDGAGKILAFAGPCLNRNASSGGLTAFGVMIFDSDDIQTLIARGTIRDVIEHEMLHIVGIGTLWDNRGILLGARTIDSRFTGAAGVAACAALGGSSICAGSVPLENCANCPGTSDSHWRESTFGGELMTGFVNAAPNPYSIMSIESLADVGYVVNPSAADVYNIPGQSASQTRSNVLLGGDAPAWETVLKPRMLISRTGQLSPVEKQ
ncbi:MAG: leishmanolysin-related zinc metalloendopeptidase [Gemmatimonadaceae bacterium]